MRNFFLSILLFACANPLLAQEQFAYSPSKNIRLSFFLDNAGTPHYQVFYKERPLILDSRLGIKLSDGDMTRGFQISGKEQKEIDGSWSPVWGEEKEIRNHCNELIVHLKQSDGQKRVMDIVFRVFDDGVGFRYVFPPQSGMNHFVVTDEVSEFQLIGDHTAFWIPGDYDSNEYPYTKSLLSQVDGRKVMEANSEISTRVVKDASSVATPLMMKTADGLYINLHEAALVNYPAMQLHVDKSSHTLVSALVPDVVGNKAYLQTPSKTPWRTILVSDKATDILASRTILNLNEPSVIKDPSWIKPMKFVGIWWEMHADISTWDYAGTQNTGNWSELKPSGKHGATTEKTKRYIDFAAANGIQGVLVEGWNVGWEDWFGKWKENVFDFITPYPDYDLPELARYAKSKGVEIIMHHETSASVTNYERYMDTAYRLMKNHDIENIKSGYVGKIIPRGEYHDGQWMINHYNRVAEKTAAYKITIDMHESVRPTGMHRTYPNWLACEAARGNEFNAWSKGNPPEHETILPFTRLMGGPMDYTPGIFRIKLADYTTKKEYVHTTLAKQLALYVTMYSPLQMAADLPQNYEQRMDAFQFIKEVPVDWDDTKILEAEPGDYVTIARKGKGMENWFIGAITDENARTSKMPLSFLDEGKTYVATFYKDGKEADWFKNPEVYTIEKWLVHSKTNLEIPLAAGGGCAISIRPATSDESKNPKKYKLEEYILSKYKQKR